MNQKLIKEFEELLGKNRVLSEAEELLCYSYDATSKEFMPDVVVFPLNSNEISNIVKLCLKYNTPVVGRGSGSGFSGGSLPLKGGVVVSFTKMNHILEIDEENMFVTVEPGVINADLKSYLAEKGYFYPPDPASYEFSTIGGNVAECSGGPSAVKYGVTKDYVAALELITGDGEIINTGSKSVKDVSGYNLTQLMVGSEGTLGLFSKITLKFLSNPEANSLILVSFDDIGNGFNAAISLLKLRNRPSMLEFMDKSSIESVKSYFKSDIIKIEGAFLFIIEADGSRLEVGESVAEYEKILKEFSPVFLFSSGSEEEKRVIMEARKAISPSLRKYGDLKINNDIAVPINKIIEMLSFIEGISKTYNVPIINFGHFGDGNIHVNIMLNKDDADMVKRGEKAKFEILKKTAEAGGSLSGEHGIGLEKKEFMKLKYNDYYMNILKNIKKVFDPRNIINPGKIF
ncbi:MAG: FAD-binding protein [Deltaproteobacteria bacterium]|jgi:glycolate oxidase|nr:FAD-binding protein [Deltaproteobacteria bacterium]MCL5880468.1 FAD-binding protein [Deltaproteobacteria bacterium]MDA8304649.1 FAD-binding protein [Deltaproteobacteria bacterium]